MYLCLLKWSLYTRINRRFLNLNILRSFRKEILILLFIIVQAIKAITVLIGTNFILNNNYVLIDNIYIDNILRGLQDNKIVLLMIFCGYVILDLYKNSIKAVKLKEDSKITNWILANTKAEKSKVMVTLLLEYIIFSGLHIVTFQVPIISSILIKLNYSILMTSIISLFYIITLLLLTILNSLIYNMYLHWVKNLKSIKVIIINNVFVRVVFVTAFYFLGRSLSSWMNEFPLIHQKVELVYFENWTHKFNVIFTDVIVDNLNTTVTSIFNINKKYLILSMIIIIVCLCFCIVMMNLLQKRTTESSYTKILIKDNGNMKSSLWYSIKTILNSKYMLRNINAFCGNISYWIGVGFYTGILQYITPNSKVYYFVIMSYAFYPIYFLIDYFFENLSGKCCIDGEGKKIYFWIDKNIFKLFKYKRLLFMSDLFLIVITANLIISIFNNISFKISMLTCITQIIFVYTLYNLFSLSSIIFPHFEHSTVEELSGYGDRNQLNETVSFIIVMIGIPILVLPTVLYLTDYLTNYMIYIIIQFVIIGVVLILANIIFNIFVKRKVNSKDFVYSIFEK